MRVLVIPEDFRKDQYILKPIVKALLSDIGKSRAKIEVCKEPLPGGVGEALKSSRIADIIERYRGMVDCFLLVVDRDGNENRRQRLDDLEGENPSVGFLAENAWQEVEAWVLAGLDLPGEWVWKEVRSEPDVKEVYFEPLAKQLHVAEGPGGGRKSLAEKAARKIARIISLCPEDVGSIKTRLETLS